MQADHGRPEPLVVEEFQFVACGLNGKKISVTHPSTGVKLYWAINPDDAGVAVTLSPDSQSATTFRIREAY
jgi:hypothetical protein